MKKYIIFILIQLFFVRVSAQNIILDEAADVYSKGDFNKSAELYEKVLKENGESATIYYNLGNAYYKANKIAPSILNYERALLLDPGNGDIRFNLEIAKLKTTDKIEPIGDFFLTEWAKGVRDLFSADQWAYIGIVSFLLLITSVIAFLFSRKIILKKVGFYIGIICLIFVVSANIFAYNQKNRLIKRDVAIIFAPTVTIKSSPDQSGKDLIVLHEGTKVLIKSKLGEWTEIELEDGRNVGWIKNNQIEII